MCWTRSGCRGTSATGATSASAAAPASCRPPCCASTCAACTCACAACAAAPSPGAPTPRYPNSLIYCHGTGSVHLLYKKNKKFIKYTIYSLLLLSIHMFNPSSILPIKKRGVISLKPYCDCDLQFQWSSFVRKLILLGWFV